MAVNLYLRSAELPDDLTELTYIEHQKRTCYNTGIYPFKMFPDMELSEIEFAPITIFYGGNGSGKTTLLNILAELTGAARHSAFSGSPFFADYVSMCRMETYGIPEGSQVLTSDDVSDYLLDVRALNDGIDRKRNELIKEHNDRMKDRRDGFYRSVSPFEDYDEWERAREAAQQTQSRFVRNRLPKNVNLFSNGETAMKYYVDRIDEDALYLIDEPENSLSPKLQTELAEFFLTSVKYYGCQLVISTHSPFFLSLPGAKIYDLDDVPVRVKPWTELEHIRDYYRFFRTHGAEIEASMEE